MAERTIDYPEALLGKAARIVTRAVIVRGALSSAIPGTEHDLNPVTGCTFPEFGDRIPESDDEGFLVGLTGQPDSLAYQPGRWIASILAGDCIDETTGKIVAYYTRTDPSNGFRTSRTSLRMTFEDARMIVTACATMSGVPTRCLKMTIRRRLEEGPAISLNRPSSEGHPPVALHWAKIL